MPKKYTVEEFIEVANKKHHNFFSYEKVKFISLNDVITIICPKHGPFEQKAINHLHHPSCCPICSDIKKKQNRLYTKETFIEICNKAHNNFYDYTSVNYINSQTKVTIVCPKHGPFEQKANDHMQGHGCPICKSSKGELKIKHFLDDSNITFIPQYTFEDCRGKVAKLPFDFYLPEYNILIEFDGKQHFTGWNNSIEKLKILQETDAIKNKYCADNCIRLLRISYKEISLIEEKIKQFLI